MEWYATNGVCVRALWTDINRLRQCMNFKARGNGEMQKQCCAVIDSGRNNGIISSIFDDEAIGDSGKPRNVPHDVKKPEDLVVLIYKSSN